jgi:hypothetical protein
MKTEVTLSTDDEFRMSFRASAIQPDADLVVAVQTVYVRLDDKPPLANLTAAVSRDFIERVAVMAAFPFLRQGLISLASMLRVEPPVLHLLRAGMFTAEVGDPAASASIQDSES